MERIHYMVICASIACLACCRF